MTKQLPGPSLHWPGKNAGAGSSAGRLLEDPASSHGDLHSGNLLIRGDNLPVLQALQKDYAGRIKFIYIDPPYNTGAAFEYYDDKLGHSAWLEALHQRLHLFSTLLTEDGFFACHIDDSEGHYLKVLLDEVFGRDNYLTTFFIRVRYPDKTLKQDMDFHKEIEQIHLYRKGDNARPLRRETALSLEKFSYAIEELAPGAPAIIGDKQARIFKKGEYHIVRKPAGDVFGLKEIWASGSILDGNSSGRFFRDHLTGRYEQDGYGVLYKIFGIGDDRYDHRYFTGPKKAGATKGKYFQGVPAIHLQSEGPTRTSPINNFYDLAASFGNCRQEGGVDFRSGKKPEALLQLLLSHFSSEGDYVLDGFLGSGTTAAAAHKMKRKWIGIESGEQALTHCLPRLRSVVDGNDKTGITEQAGWQGGGGFKVLLTSPPAP